MKFLILLFVLVFSNYCFSFDITPEKEFFSTEQMNKRSQTHTYYKANGSADLRKFDSPIETQFGGTCTAHALRNVIDNKGEVRVSTRHIWNKYQRPSCESAIKAWLNKDCITSAEAWPQQSTKPVEKDYLGSIFCNSYLKKVNYINSDLGQMKRALDNRNPVYLGITVTKSMITCDKYLKPRSRSVHGGHALAIVGYKDSWRYKGGGYFIIKNSWGASCGDKGYQYVPYYYCMRKDLYCVMWEIESVDSN